MHIQPRWACRFSSLETVSLSVLLSLFYFSPSVIADDITNIRTRFITSIGSLPASSPKDAVTYLEKHLKRRNKADENTASDTYGFFVARSADRSKTAHVAVFQSPWPKADNKNPFIVTYTETPQTKGGISDSVIKILGPPTSIISSDSYWALPSGVLRRNSTTLIFTPFENAELLDQLRMPGYVTLPTAEKALVRREDLMNVLLAQWWGHRGTEPKIVLDRSITSDQAKACVLGDDRIFFCVTVFKSDFPRRVLLTWGGPTDRQDAAVLNLLSGATRLIDIDVHHNALTGLLDSCLSSPGTIQRLLKGNIVIEAIANESGRLLTLSLDACDRMEHYRRKHCGEN